MIKERESPLQVAVERKINHSKTQVKKWLATDVTLDFNLIDKIRAFLNRMHPSLRVCWLSLKEISKRFSFYSCLSHGEVSRENFTIRFSVK